MASPPLVAAGQQGCLGRPGQALPSLGRSLLRSWTRPAQLRGANKPPAGMQQAGVTVKLQGWAWTECGAGAKQGEPQMAGARWGQQRGRWFCARACPCLGFPRARPTSGSPERLAVPGPLRAPAPFPGLPSASRETHASRAQGWALTPPPRQHSGAGEEAGRLRGARGLRTVGHWL